MKKQKNKTFALLGSLLRALNEYSNLIIALVALFGLSFLICEVKELRRQTNISEMVMRRTKRPFLIVENFHDKKKAIEIRWELNDDGTYKFSFNLDIANRGDGPLLYVGSLQYYANEKFNFRSEFLKGRIDSTDIDFDWTYDLSRNAPFLPSDNTTILVSFFKVESRKEHYFYIMMLYKDIAGNLYDTIFVIYARYDRPYIGGDKISKSVYNEYFYPYKISEKLVVKNILEKYHKGMSEYIDVD